MAIPKIIHQAYFKKVGLPALVEKNINFLKGINPGWEYRLYDDNDMVDFIKSHYPKEILSLYNKINPAYGAAKADLFRYLVIYKLGGVYLDIKSNVFAPLDEITSGKQYILSHWPSPPANYSVVFPANIVKTIPKGEYQQWHVIAEPEHPFLKAVIEKVFDNIENYFVDTFGVGFHGTLRTTGPVPYTMAIHRIIDKHPHALYPSNNAIKLAYIGRVFGLACFFGGPALYTKEKPSYKTLNSSVVFHSEVNHAYQTDSADNMQTDMQLSM